MARYIIIGTQRSGTTVLHLALKGHPQVSALNDEMRIHPFFTQGLNAFTFGNNAPGELESYYNSVFDSITRLNGNTNTKANGLKIASSSMVMVCTLVKTLQNHMPDIKVIIVRREDLVAQLGSAKAGKMTGVMHSWYDDNKKGNEIKFNLNKWHLIHYVVNSKDFYNELAKLEKTHDVLNVCYEDLLDKNNTVYERMFAFLGLDVIEPTWIESDKVRPPADKYILNYGNMTDLEKKVSTGQISTLERLISKYYSNASARIKRFRKKIGQNRATNNLSYKSS